MGARNREKVPDGKEKVPNGKEKVPDGKEKIPDGKGKEKVPDGMMVFFTSEVFRIKLFTFSSQKCPLHLHSLYSVNFLNQLMKRVLSQTW